MVLGEYFSNAEHKKPSNRNGSLLHSTLSPGSLYFFLGRSWDLSLWFCLSAYFFMSLRCLTSLCFSCPFVSPLWIPLLFLGLCDSPGSDLCCPRPSSHFPSPVSLPMPTPCLFLVLWPLAPRLYYPLPVLRPLHQSPISHQTSF